MNHPTGGFLQKGPRNGTFFGARRWNWQVGTRRPGGAQIEPIALHSLLRFFPGDGAEAVVQPCRAVHGKGPFQGAEKLPGAVWPPCGCCLALAHALNTGAANIIIWSSGPR